MEIEVTNNYYNKIRDICYVLFTLGCIAPIFIEMNTNFRTTDKSMQELLIDQHRHHNNNIICDTIDFIFIFSIGLGCSYIPSLIIDTIKTCIFKDVSANDILLFERYILTISYIIPSLSTLICIYYEYEYTGIIYLSTFRFTFLSFAYITSIVLNRTITNIWTPKTTTTIFISNGFLCFIPLIQNHIINNIIASLYLCLLFYYTFKYVKEINICKILFGNNQNEWKELIVYSSAALSVIHIVILILSISIIGRAGAMNANIDILIAFHCNKMFTFITLATIYSTVPGTLSAVQNSTITSLRTFIRHLSHEIRTPMNVVQMNLENLVDKLEKVKPKFYSHDYEEIIEITTESVESSEVAVEILNDILEVDKIIQGLEKYEKQPYNFGKFVEKTCRIFAAKAVTKGVTLDYSDWEKFSHISINIDYNKMGMVLRNFVSNAMKFTDEGGTITVNISFIGKYNNDIKNNKVLPDEENQTSNPFIRVEVIDNGIGISQSNINELFNRSIQIEASKTQGGKGSGFGLLIAKQHIEAHDGYIGVTSLGLGKGSCFWFEIPIIKIPSENNCFNIDTSEKEIELRNSEDTRIKLKGEKPTVLIVEDAPSNAKVLGRSLSLLNCNVKIVENGQLCIDEIKNNNIYDIIFMDNKMPVLDGPKAASILRSNGYTLPIIGLTGNIMDDDIKYFIENGANVVFGKPTKRDKLNEILKNYLIL